MKKWYWGIFFIFFICMSLFAQQETDFEYLASDGGNVTIIGYTGTTKAITIPRTINGITVTIIGPRAFANKQLTSVTIPNSVIVIMENAFTGNNLTSVTISSNIRIIAHPIFESASLNAIFMAYGSRGGTYEYRNSQWFLNGTQIAQPAQLVCGNGIQIRRIDGSLSPGGSLRRDYFIVPGFHSIEVGYSLNTNSGQRIGFPATFEQIFESGGVYDLTGTIEGDQIVYRIRRR